MLSHPHYKPQLLTHTHTSPSLVVLSRNWITTVLMCACVCLASAENTAKARIKALMGGGAKPNSAELTAKERIKNLMAGNKKEL